MKNQKMKNIWITPEDKIKTKVLVIFYGLLISSTAIYYGIGVGQFNNFYKKFLEEIYDVTEHEEKKDIKSNISFCYYVGGLTSAFTASLLYDNLGRLKSLILIVSCSIIVSFLYLI